MFAHLRERACRLLEQECRQAGLDVSGFRLLRDALDEMLLLLAETHDQPARRLAPSVRKLIEQRRFVEDAGDPVFPGQEVWDLHEDVAVAIQVLERVRLMALREGIWCDQPTTPQMCG